ncbi:MAG: DUF3306 domain-containing protein [Hylemonella sp.]|uniref:DUF3306 domain-containing protein n=1 Tax=Hylemonella sp. TaxID=2066020 RepID=UPI0022BADA04|nr:DUF3306 domain-containing protein [Hylemonella sp.]MCZ8253120.1 DUF3306 domain-containing protein [Hylemonella sp.]
MAEGFLGRWSQRKQALREGKPLEEPLVSVAPPTPAPAVAARTPPVQAEPGAAPEVEAPPPPTLEEAQALTPQSDFRRYVAGDVDPEVRHAAMRKLFSDPHFNVMDGLDIYIDDYNTPNPMPASMLSKMASAHFLGLVEEEQEKKPQAPAAVQPTHVAVPAQDVKEPESPQTCVAETDETPHHDDPDLRLQQDHAAGPQGPGRGA